MIKVLDKGWIELLDTIPAGRSGDKAIVEAARTSYNGESKGEEKDKKLLFYLYKNKHMSPFEQVQMKFRIYAPLVVWWQLLRHRTAKPNLASGRYTEFKENEFYLPEVWRLQDLVSNKQGSNGVASEEVSSYCTKTLEKHFERSYELYEEVLKLGIAKEQARLFLPGFAVYYTGVVTFDVRNLMNFFSQRMDRHAQYEIRMYANAMYNSFKEFCPWTAEAFENENNVISN